MRGKRENWNFSAHLEASCMGRDHIACGHSHKACRGWKEKKRNKRRRVWWEQWEAGQTCNKGGWNGEE